MPLEFRLQAAGCPAHSFLHFDMNCLHPNGVRLGSPGSLAKRAHPGFVCEPSYRALKGHNSSTSGGPTGRGDTVSSDPRAALRWPWAFESASFGRNRRSPLILKLTASTLNAQPRALSIDDDHTRRPLTDRLGNFQPTSINFQSTFRPHSRAQVEKLLLPGGLWLFRE